MTNSKIIFEKSPIGFESSPADESRITPQDVYNKITLFKDTQYDFRRAIAEGGIPSSRTTEEHNAKYAENKAALERAGEEVLEALERLIEEQPEEADKIISEWLACDNLEPRRDVLNRSHGLCQRITSLEVEN